MNKVPRHIYRVVRALLFAAILAVVGLYLLIYVFVSMPALQKKLVSIAEREVSALIGSEVKIGRLEIFPFNEVRLSDVRLYEPSSKGLGKECLYIGQLGAGIELAELLQGNLVISYTELSRVDINIYKRNPETPYNIQFIIDALKPKEKKESTNINLNIHTVVIRKLNLSYDLLWIPETKGGFSPAHLRVSNFRADISIPSIDTSPFAIETKIRRIAFTLNKSLEVKDLSFNGQFSEDKLSVSKLLLELPSSTFSLADIELEYSDTGDLVQKIRSASVPFQVNASVTPSDLALFLPKLSDFHQPWTLNISGRYNIASITDLSLTVNNESPGFDLQVVGDLHSLEQLSDVTGNLEISRLDISPEMTAVAEQFLPKSSEWMARILSAIGHFAVDLKGNICRNSISSGWSADITGDLMTDIGTISVDSEGTLSSDKLLSLSGEISSNGLEIGQLIDNPSVGETVFNLGFDFSLQDRDVEGCIELQVPVITYQNSVIEDLTVFAEKNGQQVNINAQSAGDALAFSLDGMTLIEDSGYQWFADLNVNSLHSELLGLKGKLAGSTLSGNLSAEITGTDIDNLCGMLTGSDINLTLKDGGSLSLKKLALLSDIHDDGARNISLSSDYADCQISGRFTPSALPTMIVSLIDGLLPAFNPLKDKIHPSLNTSGEDNLDLTLTLKPLGNLADILDLPFRPLVDSEITAQADFVSGQAQLSVNFPYLRKGKSSLVRDTELKVLIPARGKLSLSLSTLWPFKDIYCPLEIRSDLYGNEASLKFAVSPDGTGPLTGDLSIDAFASNILGPALSVTLNSSQFKFNGEDWKIEKGNLSYMSKKLIAKDLKISHAGQFLLIDGTASADPNEKLKVTLADIDLAFIFDTLNINYVNFGGRVSGGVIASELFSKTPKAETVGLKAVNFSYSGALLGDADLYGIFEARDKSIGIKAKITNPLEGNRRTADADGRIWIGRDSLSFNFDADRLNASFLEQFMSAFASDMTATASGKVHLYGTFKDIDLRGHAYADSIRFKLNYTGVYYSGKDSVYFDPGCIRIPSFRIYDREGHSGVFSGELHHKFLHDANFDFYLKDASRLLAYDLPKVTPDDIWWGTVYASGNATVRGIPGMTTIDVEMNTDRNSEFVFSLSDSEAAKEYNFLTFTDKTPRTVRSDLDDTPDFVSKFRNQKINEVEEPGHVHIDLRLNATPGVLVTLIMDPVSGDKITARGEGPLQIQYETENDEPRIYGKYTITEGLYNFSLQDVILRDFRIEEGSTISFNGDPLAANLDIRAAYRVNTSLTDLDKSFAMDRDLNRTNVPVDAMLLVRGPLDSPDIGFDIELPTLTDEMSRKVKSIISTNDLMSRQIIYLLALNKFYTPEYMNTTASGNELTSVASSTISSQLGNALSQLTDKLNVMPSIRSDKGDFSDLEMDLGLSSRLLNNRLLINGNFGYRDRTSSTTTFVGDFDVEYLLNRRGSFRLKAYNHFNDQNYYLRQALTTQGIGVEFRHDFNNLFKHRPAKETRQRTTSREVRDTILRPEGNLDK